MGSSNVMWAIALCYHPESDLYYLNDKEERVFDMVKEKNFTLDDYQDHISVFKDMCLTQAQKSLTAWEEQMRKRDKYLKSQEYYFDQYLTDDNGDNVVSKTGKFIVIKGTADQLDKAYSTTPKMYSDYDKIKKELEREEQVKGKGGKNVSLSDSGDI